MKTLFFIPCFNEVSHLPLLLQELKETELPCDTVLFINNGSTDGSAELMHESGHPYVDLPKNIGVGYAILRGIEIAIAEGYDIFGLLAGNVKMLPSEIGRIVQPIIDDEVDYVTGSRFLEGGDSPNLPLFRRLMIPGVNVLSWLTTGCRLTDSTCGFRACRVELMKTANFDWHAEWLHTYGLEYYIYAKALRSGWIRWKEVPITMRYPPTGQSYSKIPPVTGWWAMSKPWLVAAADRKAFVQPTQQVGTSSNE